MAKKKPQDEKTLVQIALDTHKWINTPVSFTNSGTPLTKVQQDIMLMVVGHLQDYLKKYLDEDRYRDKKNPNPMMTEEDLSNLQPIQIKLAELGLGDGHYGIYSSQEYIDELQKLWIKVPEFDKITGIRKGDSYMPIFTKVFVPQSRISQQGEEYKYERKVEQYDEDGNILEYTPQRRDGFMELTINKSVAKYAFNMSTGYFNHLERIAYFCNSIYSARIYLKLMSCASRGSMTPVINYIELKEFIGVIEKKFVKKEGADTQEEGTYVMEEVGKEVHYKKYAQFKKLVLEVAKKDLERLASENKTEIVFTYEPVYRGLVKRGEPDSIKFYIKKTNLGNARYATLRRGKNEDDIMDKLLDIAPTLNYHVIRDLFAQIPDEHWSKFYKFIMSNIKDIIEKNNPEDRSSYIVAIIKNWINQNDITPIIEDEPQQPIEGDLFTAEEMSGKSAPVSEASASDTPTTPAPVCIPGDRVGEWQQILSLAAPELKELLTAATYLGTTDGIMTYSVADIPTRSRIEILIAEQPDIIKVFRSVSGMQFGPYMKTIIK